MKTTTLKTLVTVVGIVLFGIGFGSVIGFTSREVEVGLGVRIVGFVIGVVVLFVGLGMMRNRIGEDE